MVAQRSGLSNPFDQRVMDLESQIRKRRDADLQAGRERGQELFGGGLDLQGLTRERLQGLQQQASGGMAAPQFANIRGTALGGIQGALGSNLQQLQAQQGASGVRGAAAQAGVQRAQQQANIARRGLLSDLAVQDIGLRERGLRGLGEAVNRERFGQLGTEFGFAGLGAQTSGQAGQIALGEHLAAIAAGRLGGGGGGGGFNKNLPDALSSAATNPGRDPISGEKKPMTGVPPPGKKKTKSPFEQFLQPISIGKPSLSGGGGIGGFR